MFNAQFVSALKEALNGLRTVHTVGEEWCSYIGKIPTGGVPYCGQEVTRSTYSALWQYAQNQGLVKSESEWQSIAVAQGGNVPFYSSGDGSSTFRMPRLVGYVRGASSQSESGAYVSEGLPNITSSVSASWGFPVKSADLQSGAIKFDNFSTNIWSDDSSSTSYSDHIDFDASRSSAIYGNSGHVTPETSCVLFGVYAFGEVSNVDALDAGTLVSALARVEANIVTPARYVTEKWSNGTSWYTKYSDGWIEQGGKSPSGEGLKTITLPAPFSDANYTALTTGLYTGGNTANAWDYVRNVKATSFDIYQQSAGCYWYACGY